MKTTIAFFALLVAGIYTASQVGCDSAPAPVSAPAAGDKMMADKMMADDKMEDEKMADEKMADEKMQDEKMEEK